MIYANVIVLLTFESNRVEKSISILSCIANFLGGKSLFLIVNNNEKKFSIRNEKNINAIFLSGCNDSWEFSGWDVAIKYLRNMNLLHSKSRIVFANDTVGYHRIYNKLDCYFFAKSILNNMTEKKPILIGERNGFGEDFLINGGNSSSWISTYLFGTNKNYIDVVHYFSDIQEVNCIVNCSEGKILSVSEVLGVSISNNLLRHINHWFFPVKKHHGWYAADKIRNGDISLLNSKLKSILNEKIISIKCVKNDGILIDVYASFFGGIYFKIKRFAFIFIKKCFN